MQNAFSSNILTKRELLEIEQQTEAIISRLSILDASNAIEAQEVDCLMNRLDEFDCILDKSIRMTSDKRLHLKLITTPSNVELRV